MNENKILHFSHASDLDGKFCHMLTSLIYEPEDLVQVDVYNNDMETCIQEYLKENRDEFAGATIIISDLGLKASSLREIVDLHYGPVHYIDHHPSMTEEELKLSGAIVRHDTKCSAAKLLQQFLMSVEQGNNLDLLKRLDYITELVSDYDTFQFKTKDTLEAEWLNIYYHQDKDDFYNKIVYMLSTEKYIGVDFVKETFYTGTCVEFKIKERTEFIEIKKKKIKIVNIDSLNVGLLITDHWEYVSELGYVVCRELEDRMDLLMIISPDSTSVQIRSCKGNATEFAKAHGGGGHPNASGFQTTIEYISELINLYHKYAVKAYL